MRGKKKPGLTTAERNKPWATETSEVERRKRQENGNQAIEHTDKTKARIQTYPTTTTATAVSNR
jgi:hypothetical protein